MFKIRATLRFLKEKNQYINLKFNRIKLINNKKKKKNSQYNDARNKRKKKREAHLIFRNYLYKFSNKLVKLLDIELSFIKIRQFVFN